MPRVTVVMATYNWATVLPWSIGSALDQTFTDFELLVVGDGCTDESGAVVSAMDDRRVHWHNLPANSGHQAAPNNLGIRRAEGDLIAYLGHDDVWLPRHLEVLVDAIDDGARLAHATTLRVVPSASPTTWPPPWWTYEAGAWIPPTTVVHERALTEGGGGWRTPSETGIREPEGDLWGRLVAGSEAPRWVSRLTSVKLPAAQRQHVYRERPAHEQAYWVRRIREADDPEQALLAACDTDYIYADPTAPAPGGAEPVTAEARWRARRLFKGIDG